MGEAIRLFFLLPLLVVVLLGFVLAGEVYGFWKLPPQAPPSEFGTITIDRNSTAMRENPVVFPHWVHRLKYTCRVCHFELEFEFRRNTTPITERDNRNGLYCGKCHNGATAFGHKVEYCHKCHGGDKAGLIKKFDTVLEYLPHSEHGNGIDWIEAIRITKPKYSIFLHEKPIRFKKVLVLRAKLRWIPQAVFPHWEHVQLLDCSSCHPDIFNLKKKTTKHFSMDGILQGEFCGACHLNVAFPVDPCKRCHPGMKER